MWVRAFTLACGDRLPALVARHARMKLRAAQPPLLERGRQAAARLVEADGQQARARDRSALGEGLDRPAPQVVQIGDGIIGPATK